MQTHLERAKEEGLKEIELFEAIPSSEKEYIWCSELETVSDKSKCNKDCPYYKVSGKSKICDFRGKLMNFGKQLKFKVNKMQILELKLKKDVLIVDTTAPIEAIEIDDYEFLCKGSELTEEIASELVDYWQNMANDGFIFENYKDNIPKKSTAIKSFISAIESKGFYWLENLIEKPKHYDLWAKYGDYTQYGKKLTEEYLKWQEAEEKTFKNPLIFVKK